MTERCFNCDTPLDGDFCSKCGQSIKSLDVPIRTFANEFARESLGVDGRIRTTLGPLLFKPGRVAKEYVLGRRARFVAPVRLYVFASFFMFLTIGIGQRRDAAVADARAAADSIAAAASADSVAAAADPLTEATSGDSLTADSSRADEDASVGVAGDSSDPATSGPDISALEAMGFEVDFGGSEFETQILPRLNAGAERALEDRQAFYQDISNGFAASMFFLLPFFAFLMKLVYWRRLYVHHLVFTLYLHCLFFLLVGIATLPGALVPGWNGWWELSVPILVPVYTLLAVRHFYDSSWIGTVLRLMLVGFIYMIVVTVVWVGIMLGSLWVA